MKYEDERLNQLEQEKQNELNNTNKVYDDLMNERNDLTNQQNDLVNRWETTQNENLDKQLEFQKDLIDQQKKEAEERYQNEARSSYTDYRKENDAYGVSREQQAQAGLGNSGYSESSRVSMYNTYQNRLSTARKSMDKAYLEFDNAIREAQLQNDVTKAENALKSLQQKLDIAMSGFEYKNQATQNKLNWQNQIGNRFDNKYQQTINQINYEKEQEEDLRRYNEQMAYQKEQDRIANELAREQWEYKKQQDELAKQQWEREYALRNRPRYSGGGSSSGGSSRPTYTITDNSKSNIFGNSSNTTNKSDYYFKSTTGTDYQPRYVNDTKLNKTGKKVSDVFGNIKGTTMGGKNIWEANGRYYAWVGTGKNQGEYVEITNQYKDKIIDKKKTNYSW